MYYRKKILFMSLCSLTYLLVGCSHDDKNPESTVEMTESGYYAQIHDDSVSDSFYSSIMGEGVFSKVDDYLYFTNNKGVYEYSVKSLDTVALQENSDVSSLCVDGDVIYETHLFQSGFGSYDIRSREAKTIYNASDTSFLYASGDYAYVLTCGMGDLLEIYMKDGSSTALTQDEKVIDFAKTSEGIYYIIYEEDTDSTALKFIKNGEKNVAKTIDVGMNPIKIFAKDNEMILSEMSTYQLYRFAIDDGTLSKIGDVSSLRYYLYQDDLYYLGEKKEKEEVIVYNLETDEKKVICEKALNFTLFPDGSFGAMLEALTDEDEDGNEFWVAGSNPIVYYENKDAEPITLLE